jgi:hypothetical protein
LRRQPPLSSWHSCLLALRASSPSVAGRSRVQKGPKMY